jgi:SAM-dependent methyltransferase
MTAAPGTVGTGAASNGTLPPEAGSRPTAAAPIWRRSSDSYVLVNFSSADQHCNPSRARADAGILLGGMLKSIDRYLGRGSYYWLKDRIDPTREYTQLTYASMVGEVLTPQTRWLDAGGGHQIFEVATPDMEREMVSRVRLVMCCDLELDHIAKHRSIRVGVGATLGNLPFRSRSLDLITLNNVAEHLERPREVLGEFARVLAPGGRVIIHTPNVASYPVRIAEVGRRVLPKPLVMKLIRYMDFREEEDVFPTFYRANTGQTLTAAASEAGLVKEKIKLALARPMFYFIAPLCAVQLAADRVMMRMGAERFAATVILAVFRKPA